MTAAADRLAPCFTAFLSAKGGVGRSLAAVHVAALLAARGFRVLLIDLDLESSGISSLFPGEAARRGVVDLLLAAVDDGRRADLHRDDAAASLANYAEAVALPPALRGAPEGSLHLLPTGRVDAAALDRLAATVLADDGPQVIEGLRDLVVRSGRFDHVVIDGRSGASAVAWIARQLGDQHAIVTGLGRQHLAGTAGLLASLRGQGTEAPLVVLSPVPAGEDALVIARVEAARAAFEAAFGAPITIDLEIPYHPQLAVDEGLHLFQRGRGALFAAYAAIEGRLLAMAGDTVGARIDAAIDAFTAGRHDAALEHLRRARLVADGDPGWLSAFAFRFADAGAPPDAATRPLFDLVLAEASASARSHLARKLGRGAMSAWDQGEHGAAEAAFAAAIEADPEYAANHANFANFLCDARRDLDRAEAMYRRTLELDPEGALYLCNYATFLCDERRDLDAAEAMYERALAVDPEHALTLCNYATFLYEERGDAAAAETMYIRAQDADPESPDPLANLGRVLLEVGRTKEGIEEVERALLLVDADAPAEVDAECWMYLYCCDVPERHEEALERLRALVDEHGVTTGSWSFAGIVRCAEAMRHRESAWLRPLAEVLAGRQPAATLEPWPAWRAAAPG